MADETRDSTEIKETDIIFDCPYCGKSLAIDYRGAGLMIPCMDCGKTVEVPIPEGMDIGDIDSSDEDQEIQILHLRRLLSESEYRIQQLQGELEDATARRDLLERERTVTTERNVAIKPKMDALQSTLQAAVETVGEIMKEIED